MQPKIVCYHHAVASFLTKPAWLKAIKKKQFVSWPGLTANAVDKHCPESKETHKGHSRKMRSGLRSTKMTTTSNEDDKETKPMLLTLCIRSSTMFLITLKTRKFVFLLRFWYFQYVFHILKVQYRISIVSFNLLVTLFEKNVRWHTFLNGFSCPIANVQ
jgi:hypothetical protein